MVKRLPPRAELLSRYSYDEMSGRIFNTNTGRPAFASRIGDYLRGIHNGSIFKAHRIAWKMHHGTEPPDVIDHINGDTLDNRISNLRDGTGGTNSRNMRLFRNNVAGVTGIHRRRDRNSWRALIYVGGRKIELGCFKRLEDAIAARHAAATRYGFSERHGT
jgi:hypothetical protein